MIQGRYGRLVGAALTTLVVAVCSYVTVTAAGGLPPGAMTGESRVAAVVCLSTGVALGGAYYRRVHPRLAHRQ